MRRIAKKSLAMLLAGLGSAAFGQELRWQPAAPQPAVATLGRPVGVAQLGKPTVARGVSEESSFSVRGQVDDTPAIAIPEPGRGGYSPTGYYPPTNYQPAPPAANYTTFPAPDYSTAPVPSARGEAVRRTSFSSRSHTSRFNGDTFYDWCDSVKECCTSEGRVAFESDHGFDTCYISPVTNPFLFEDPRSLTEIRPILMYQTIPNSNSIYQGGSAFFYGMQARVAFTERFSFVMNKLGGITINPGSASGLADESGLAELWFGPKYTFVRRPESGTAAAIGLTFQIPVGPSKVFQDTGDFSMVPYLSFAQNFGRSSYGTWNFMDTLGYAFQVGSGRSDYFYNSAHIDFDVANGHKFYPLLELNWFHYTSAGNSRPTNMEGRDLANVGATDVSGNDYLSIAPGFRYKFTECVQLGLATEFAFGNSDDFEKFRLTVDMIFRY